MTGFAGRLVQSRHRPAALGAGPLGGQHLQAVVDLVVDPELGSGVGDVLLDRRAVGEDLHVHPRTELEPEGVHVGVRTDTGIAEQVPRAADPLAPLEHGDGLVRQRGLQVTRRADTGQARADDQDVEVWCGHGIRMGEGAMPSIDRFRHTFVISRHQGGGRYGQPDPGHHPVGVRRAGRRTRWGPASFSASASGSRRVSRTRRTRSSPSMRTCACWRPAPKTWVARTSDFACRAGRVWTSSDPSP